MTKTKDGCVTLPTPNLLVFGNASHPLPREADLTPDRKVPKEITANREKSLGKRKRFNWVVALGWDWPFSPSRRQNLGRPFGIIDVWATRTLKGKYMKLKNTSRFDTAELRELLRVATKGISLADTAIHIKNSSRGYGGRAYASTPYISRSKYRRLITIRIGDNTYPKRISYDWRYKTAPEFYGQDWKELFVLVAAHEARHIQQFKKRWKCSEIDCEKFAGKRLAAYRKTKAAPKGTTLNLQIA